MSKSVHSGNALSFLSSELCSYRFLKGAFHERAGVLAVDPVSGDGHQVATAGHGIAQERQVSVVDVGAVKGDDVVQLPLQGLPHSFNAQDLAWEQG